MEYYEKFQDFWNSLNVSRETYLQLNQYVSLLIEENKKFNLIRFSSLEDLWIRHVIDSAQLSLYVSRETTKIVDIGSGNGCPGIVLSILCPSIEVYLIESKKKKVEFLKKCIQDLSLKAEAIWGRIEDTKIKNVDCITGRAVADLSQLLEWGQPLLEKKTYCLFPKGKKAESEIINALKKWRFTYKFFESITDKEAKIILLSPGINKKK